LAISLSARLSFQSIKNFRNIRISQGIEPAGREGLKRTTGLAVADESGGRGRLRKGED
jgi:hypothetical protein